MVDSRLPRESASWRPKSATLYPHTHKLSYNFCCFFFIINLKLVFQVIILVSILVTNIFKIRFRNKIKDKVQIDYLILKNDRDTTLTQF
jgi:type IV secretory pathway component VirB8